MSTTHLERRWLSQAQAAEYIGVTDRTLRNWVRTGSIRAHRVRGSRLIRYDRAELDAALRPVPSASPDMSAPGGESVA